jgi:hypothetical protein
MYIYRKAAKEVSMLRTDCGDYARKYERNRGELGTVSVILSLGCPVIYVCSFLLFVRLFFFYALLAVVYVSHVKDRFFNTPYL